MYWNANRETYLFSQQYVSEEDIHTVLLEMQCVKMSIFMMNGQEGQHLVLSKLLSTGEIKQLDSLINFQLEFSGIC